MHAHRFPDLLGCAYEAPRDPKGWHAFSEALREALGGAAVLFSAPPRGSLRPDGLAASGIHGDWVVRYAEVVRYARDPFAPLLDRMPLESAHFGSDLLSDDALTGTPFFLEWMQPQDLLPAPLLVGVIERASGRCTASLRVFRPRGARAYSKEDRRLVRSLLPHLRRALELESRLEQLEAERSALAFAADRLPVGLILVDRCSRVVAMNRRGERLVRSRDGLVLRPEGLGAAAPEATGELRRLLAETAEMGREGGSGSMRALTLDRPSGRRGLEVVIAALPPSEAGAAPELPALALFVSDPDEEVLLPPQILHDLYRLTPAEAKLACDLARGWSLREATAKLGITRETARSRLQDVFLKTGTCRQASLVQRLLSSSAPFGGTG